MNTNNELMTYTFGESAVRMLLIDEQPYFVAKDVCDILNIQNPTVAIQQLDDDERIKVDPKLYLGSKSNQEINLINESGLYSLVLRSNKPEAKAFKKWVTSEVLPSIRKTGGYQKDTELQQNDDFIVYQAQQILIGRVNQLQVMVEQQKDQIKQLSPHAQYAIEVLEAKTEWTATNAAKTLGLKSPQQLNFILKEMKVHRKVEGVWVLNAKYEGKGYTKVRTSAYSDSNGEVQTSKATVWTESGIRFAKEVIDAYYSLTQKS